MTIVRSSSPARAKYLPCVACRPESKGRFGWLRVGMETRQQRKKPWMRERRCSMWNPRKQFPKCRRMLGVLVMAALSQAAAHAGGIRTAAPGTVVFHGGEFILRWNHLLDRANGVAVERSFAVMGASFSPTSNTLLESEL